MSSKGQNAIRLVAVKYAKALSGAVKSEAQWLEVKKNAREFIAILEESSELRKFLRAKNFSAKVKAEVMMDVAVKQGFGESFKNFLKLVCEHGRAGELKEIFSALNREIARKDGQTPALLITAAKISDGEKNKILAALKKSVQGELIVTEKIDPEILGGFSVQTDHITVDASARTQLKKLLQSVKEGTGYDDSSV